MSDPLQPELDRTRAIVRAWLTERSTSQRTLADATGMPASSISRFLNGAALDIGSAVRLYPVLRDRLSPTDRQAFLQTTGLSALVPSSARDPFDQTKHVAAGNATPDWSQARRIITTMLTERSQSLRQLSAQAALQPSILSRFLGGDTILDASSCMKLYNVLRTTQSEAQHSFLRATGLQRFVAVAAHDTFGSGAETNLERIAKQFLERGDDLIGKYAYVDALNAYRHAEDVAKSYPRLSAKVATKIALTYTDAGYYDRAHHILHHAMQQYNAIIAPEDRVRLYRVQGWVSFAQRDYLQAERCFTQCIRVAQEAGYEQLAETAVHFLGQIYFAWGKRLPADHQLPLLHKALSFFDQAEQLHRGYSPDYAAYDLFRKSEVRAYMGDLDGAKKLRSRARSLFGADLSSMAVDLEEARIALKEGAVDAARRTIETIVEGWAAVGHVKEMAGPLRLLGDTEYRAGSPQRALPLYVAALCIYPFADAAHNRKAWSAIASCCTLIIHQHDRRALRAEISTIQNALSHRKDYFALLTDISPAHELMIASIMEKLATFL